MFSSHWLYMTYNSCLGDVSSGNHVTMSSGEAAALVALAVPTAVVAAPVAVVAAPVALAAGLVSTAASKY